MIILHNLAATNYRKSGKSKYDRKLTELDVVTTPGHFRQPTRAIFADVGGKIPWVRGCSKLSFVLSIGNPTMNFSVLVKIRAGVFYQDLKTRAEGEIFKSDKTRTTSILTGLKSFSSCELIDKIIFKINLENQSYSLCKSTQIFS